ncbi:MAG: CvpA family protein [Oscillospiraceae bacterium]
MNILFDLALVAIAAFTVWRGYKDGLIVTMCGAVAVIICLFGANIVASVYSEEFTGMLEPFVGGMVDNSISDAVAGDNAASQIETLSNGQKSDVYVVGHAALRQLGIADGAAQRIAEETEQEIDTVGQRMSDNLSEKLSRTLAFVIVFMVVFILLCIILAAIGNVLNLSFAIPGFETANHIGGAALGLVKGIIIVLFITSVCRYLGLLLSEETIQKTLITEWLINHNLIANIIGV